MDNEHIKKILGKTKYVLREASYALAKEEFQNDDSLPHEFGGPKPVMGQNDSRIFEDDEDAPEDQEMAPEDPQMSDDAIPSPDGEMPPEGEEMAPEDGEMQDDGGVSPDAIAAPEDAAMPEEPNVDELQNDLIKLNIQTIQQMNARVAELDATIAAMDAKFAELNKNVEEVKEPTNVEKLMSRKADSHPYYYGLNDMWQGNWFQARRDEVGDRGMKQLEDGSYVADFDTLPKFSDHEVKDSFNV